MLQQLSPFTCDIAYLIMTQLSSSSEIEPRTLHIDKQANSEVNWPSHRLPPLANITLAEGCGTVLDQKRQVIRISIRTVWLCCCSTDEAANRFDPSVLYSCFGSYICCSFSLLEEMNGLTRATHTMFSLARWSVVFDLLSEAVVGLIVRSCDTQTNVTVNSLKPCQKINVFFEVMLKKILTSF